MRRVILIAARVILSLVFIFSGFVKSTDITGTSIKISEYLISFNLDSISLLSPFIAIALSGFELLLGLLLLLNIFKRTTYLLTFISTIGFTILTLYILIFNPVSDCGCFGDALKLTNTETFIKNIVLVMLALSVYLYGKETYSKRTSITEKIFFCLLALYSFSIGAYSLWRLSPLDFLPYQIGVNIPLSMEIPENAAKDEFETILKYKNISTGDIKEFKESDTTWYDSDKWEYVNHSSKLIKKGFEPTITSFSIKDKDRNEVSNKILNSNNQLLIVIENIRVLNQSIIEKINRLLDGEKNGLYTISIITSSDIEIAKKYVGQYIPIYNMGQKDIQSILRHHYGAIFLDKGTILGKWDLVNNINILSEQDLTKELKSQESRQRNYLIMLLSIFLVITLTFTAINKLKKD